MSQWEQRAASDSADDCGSDFRNDGTCKCVATDDPRLKGNYIMNLRHAATVALLGWYLMLPQMKLQETKDDAAVGSNQCTDVVDKSAPLAQWTLYASFDSAAQCKAMRAQLLALPKLADHQRYVDSTCVASDDPRLKGN